MHDLEPLALAKGASPANRQPLTSQPPNRQSRPVAEAARVLRPSGWLLLELGYNSLAPVRAMLGPDWTDTAITHDLAGFLRVLAARQREETTDMLRFE